LYGLVLTRRPQKLASRYAGIWMEEGSPLLVYTRRQTEALRASLLARGVQAHVELGMRYGNPSLAGALERLRQSGCEYILTVPLYPQYAASTTATVVDAVTGYLRRWRDQPALRFIKRFYDQPGYIEALAESVETYWKTHGKPQKLLISFHGLPRSAVQRGDPYYRDCQETARLLTAKLGLMPEQVEVTFQSRFGPARWLEPYTEPRLKELAAQGVTKVDVICPGFLADCLETLEEINQECRQAFLSAGGTHFGYIPALNASASGTHALTQLVENHLQGWPAGRASDA
jgi:ferrochelatase